MKCDPEPEVPTQTSCRSEIVGGDPNATQLDYWDSDPIARGESFTDASSIQSYNHKCIDGDIPMPYFARSENHGVRTPLGLPSFDEHMEQVPPPPHAGLAIRSNSDPGPSKLTSSLKRSIGELSPLQTAIESARRRKKARSAPTSPVKYNWPEGVVRISPPPAGQDILISKLKFGVVYELARLMQLGAIPPWEDLKMSVLEVLSKGSYEDIGPRILELVNGATSTTPDERRNGGDTKDYWRELEEEERDTKGTRRLGCQKDDPQFGGKVQVAGTLKWDKGFKILLNALKVGVSTRFTRHFGSERWLYLNISKPGNPSDQPITQFLKNWIVVGGYVFGYVGHKDTTAHFLRVGRASSPMQVDKKAWAEEIYDFYAWHNPLEYNSNQTIRKWAARFQLGASTSVPGSRLTDDDIYQIDDIYASGRSKSDYPKGKPPSEEVMTDGCGFINSCGMEDVRRCLGLAERPSAVQMRLAGGKGMLLQLRDDELRRLCGLQKGYEDNELPKDYEERRIVLLRDSQKKIDHPPNSLTASQLTIDVLRVSSCKYPASISEQMLINLCHNNVEPRVLAELFVDGLDSCVNALEIWDCSSLENATNLSKEIFTRSGIIGRRLAALRTSSARAVGLVERWNEWEDDSDCEDDVPFDLSEGVVKPSMAPQSSPFSDYQSLGEKIVCMIKAGFSPHTCPALLQYLSSYVETEVNLHINKWKLDIPMSARAFMIPDPFGVLEEGEIAINFSEPVVVQTRGGSETRVWHLIGDVVLGRYPCLVPNDMQKFKAVYKEILAHIRDVIIFSTKGARSPASFLGGGDYDGDEAIIIWALMIVSLFQNAPLRYADRPKQLATQITKESKLLETLLIGEKSDIAEKLRDELLVPIKGSSRLGMLSQFHCISAYMNGYDHEESICLAYLTNVELDGAKSGERITEEAWQFYLAKYGNYLFPWNRAGKGITRDGPNPDNKLHCRRKRSLGPFITDAIKAKVDVWKHNFDARVKKVVSQSKELEADKVLLLPFQHAEERAERRILRHNDPSFSNFLKLLQKHVIKSYNDFAKILEYNPDPLSPKKKRPPVSVGSTSKDRSPFSNLPWTQRQKIMRKLKEDYLKGPEVDDEVREDVVEIFLPGDELRKVMSSFLYKHASSKGKPKCAFDLDMQMLCEIKAKSFPDHETVVNAITALYAPKRL